MAVDPGSSDPIVREFLAAYWRDEDAEAVRPLAEYLAQYPDHESAIAQAYLSLRRSAGVGSTDGDESLGWIGPYRLVKIIGRGGQGEVFLAEDTRLGRMVALKTLTGAGPRMPAQLDRFRREAEAASRLDHPNLCTIYDAGEDGSTPYIAMRYVEGRTLAEMIKHARAEETSLATAEEASDASPSARDRELWPVRLIERAARALHTAHEAGIIHRDIKPGNVIVTRGGEPVVLDFGLARDLEGDGPTLTQSGDVFGTPAYMSPEQIRGEHRKIDPRTDVYSLGLVLYECLTLENPFVAPTREGVYRAIQEVDPPDPRRRNSTVSDDLRVVLMTALDKDRDRRYATALDFAEDLRRVCAYEPIAARAPSVFTRAKRWVQRNPVLTAFAATVFTLLSAGLAVALVLLAQVRDEKQQKEEALGGVVNALAEVLQLADVKRVRDLEPWSTRLFPSRPEKIPGPDGMDAWIDEAESLIERRNAHVDAIAALRETPESERTPDAAWRLETLDELVERLDGLPPRLERMRARRKRAASVREQTLGRFRTEWDAAIAAVGADPRFAGFTLRPQLGLVPIGADPVSGLQEFADLHTGFDLDTFRPVRDDEDRLALDKRSGVVFVLVPGGTFVMGATKTGKTDGEQNCDRAAGDDEGPCRRVTLAPFFIAKFEMTQAQWARVTGDVPSVIRPGRKVGDKTVSWTHPVEHVSWTTATDVLIRLGFALPTEAQWEYAARAGTRTAFHTGDAIKSLRGYINLADAGSRGRAPKDWQLEPGFDDGYPFHAPVGTFKPNAFGLHDVHGNVWEWCRDRFGPYELDAAPGDGLRAGSGDSKDQKRIFRGGCYFNSASFARSANRSYSDPGFLNHALGVRPVRAVE